MNDWYDIRTAKRAALILKYGKKIVIRWEEEVKRWPLLLANYNNCCHLLFRDGFDEGPPKCPTIEEIAKEING